MVLFQDMLIDTPYPLLEIEDRGVYKDPLTSECTYCRREKWGRKHCTRDIVVIRRWHERSVWSPELEGTDNGGWFEWRCPEHSYRSQSSPYAANAPAHLQPAQSERCEKITLGSRCPVRTGERFDDQWLCSEHSASVVARLRVEERMRELEDGIIGPAE